ncbi:MAG: hypothetical protein K1X87_10600 [Dehalococcoidia bacterium]|nr:hypothetical protein [Dehalococcoidia bacterium]HRC62897.1 hypothetical protein [Dehalococcoidia bacterium]
MPLSQRSLSCLAFAMFALMWLAAIAQSPGGMTAFAHELVTVEQELVPPPPPEQPQQGTKEQGQLETYPGGILCDEEPDAQGTLHTECQAPALMYPY